MTARQRIIPVRRDYNRWVANQTLEDYALRFTAKSARQYSPARISQTAIGAISFLALEAIGGAITYLLRHHQCDFRDTGCVRSVAYRSAFRSARYAIRHGVDIDLLTRGAGFGYIGSTVTSLIYASFTFILFAIEASIMSGALELAFGIPLWIGYIIRRIVVIPLVTHGVRLISRFQLITQPIWIILNILPFIFIAFSDWEKIRSVAALCRGGACICGPVGSDRAVRLARIRRGLRGHSGFDAADRRTGGLPALSAAEQSRRRYPQRICGFWRGRLGRGGCAETAGGFLPGRAGASSWRARCAMRQTLPTCI